jgi:hypothetical protein
MSARAIYQQQRRTSRCTRSPNWPLDTEDDLQPNTRYKPQSPIITGPSIIQRRTNLRCRHPSSGIYPHIAATPTQANTRKIRFRFGQLCNFCGISIPIQAARSPAQPPVTSPVVLAIKASVYPSGFASALGRVGKRTSDKRIPKRMKSIAGASATKPAATHTADINLPRSTGQFR